MRQPRAVLPGLNGPTVVDILNGDSMVAVHAVVEAATIYRTIANLKDLGAEGILVTRIEAQEVVRGGIIIPDTAKEKPQEGKVVAVGNGKINDDGKRIAMDVEAGDRILFGKYSGSEIKLDDVEYVILREDEILAVIG